MLPQLAETVFQMAPLTPLFLNLALSVVEFAIDNKLAIYSAIPTPTDATMTTSQNQSIVFFLHLFQLLIVILLQNKVLFISWVDLS